MEARGAVDALLRRRPGASECRYQARWLVVHEVHADVAVGEKKRMTIGLRFNSVHLWRFVAVRDASYINVDVLAGLFKDYPVLIGMGPKRHSHHEVMT